MTLVLQRSIYGSIVYHQVCSLLVCHHRQYKKKKNPEYKISLSKLLELQGNNDMKKIKKVIQEFPDFRVGARRGVVPRRAPPHIRSARQALLTPCCEASSAWSQLRTHSEMPLCPSLNAPSPPIWLDQPALGTNYTLEPNHNNR